MKINSNTFETQSKGVSRGKNEETKTGPATDQKLFTINMPHHHRFIWLFVGLD